MPNSSQSIFKSLLKQPTSVKVMQARNFPISV